MTFDDYILEIEAERGSELNDFELAMCQALYDAGYRRGYNNGYLDRMDRDYEC